MTTTIVNDSTALVSALKAAHAGDVIQLAAGSYEPILLRDLHFDGTVTVTSQDPSAMASLNGLVVKDSQNLAFRNVEMNVAATKDFPYLVTTSSNISFDGLNVHGTMDGNSQNDVGAMMIRDSQNVTVTNSEFQQLHFAISHLNTTGVTISGNYFHDIQMDGVRGGGSSHITVSDNFFTNFHPAEGDHPDAVQFWTTPTADSASDITVTGNVVVRGEGDAIQGVFIRDQEGGKPFINVTIADNLVVGGLGNGISVNGAQNVSIANNVVAGLPDQKSELILTDVTNATMSHNTSTLFILDGATGLSETGDVVIESPTDGGALIQQAWLANRDHTDLASSDTLRGGSSKMLGLPAISVSSATSTSTVTTTNNITTSHNVLNAMNVTAGQLNAVADTAARNIDQIRLQAIDVLGTSGADKLQADGIHNTRIDAGDGNDVLTGGGVGHNTLIGGAGDDNYNVRSEHDLVVEGLNGGNDQVAAYVDYTLTDNVEVLKLLGDARYGAGNGLDNKITGSAGDDEIRGMGGNDLLFGGSDGNDRMYGGDGNDTLNGGLGADTLCGDAGNDKLYADEGDDSLSGGAGNDTLEGNAGHDTLSGGAGADTFIFREGDLDATGDRLIDFSHADGDRINLQPIDANTSLAGDQKFAFIGTSNFHHVAGELRMDISGGVTNVYGDTNGDGIADIHLVMPGAGTLVAADFVF